MSPVTDSGVSLFRCSRCPYQLWDASPEDISDHYDAFHPDPSVGIRVVHDHGPGPDLNCPWCRAALAEHDRYSDAPDEPEADREAANLIGYGGSMSHLLTPEDPDD